MLVLVQLTFVISRDKGNETVSAFLSICVFCSSLGILVETKERRGGR